jgi:Raf kinase inhibitor-like YbhB/YbcL family protein
LKQVLEAPMAFSLHSPAFQNGGAMPETYAREGDNKSPPLRWTDPPAEAKSFALIVEDPDAPSGTFRHWAVHSLGPEQRELRVDAGHGQAASGREGVNDFGEKGYGGPQPPRGHGVHHYHFRLMALDVANLEIPDGAKAATIEAAARPHVIAETEIVGTYRR